MESGACTLEEVGKFGAHTLEEIGEHFGVTRERVRQIEHIALRKFRRNNRHLGFIVDGIPGASTSLWQMLEESTEQGITVKDLAHIDTGDREDG